MNMNIINPSSSAFFQKMILNELSKLLLVLLHPVEEAFEHLAQLVNSCHIDRRLHQGDNAHPLRETAKVVFDNEKRGKTFSWKCFCEVCGRADAATANATTSNPVVCWGGGWQIAQVA